MSPHTHTVRTGETLSGIARRYGTTWQAIAHLNAITHPDQLVAGKMLRIPTRHAADHPVAAPSRPATTHPTAALPDHPAAPDPNAPPSAAGDVTDPQLRAIMPNAGVAASTYTAPLNTAMRSYGIDTPERRAAFLAQISVESGDLRNTEENLNYSAERLHQVWPRRFPTVAAAQPYAHNPEALANHVYANRLGNGDEASGDGYRYRGRGLMQVTGRSNYRAAGFEDHPEQLAGPTTASNSAAQFWSQNGLNGRSATVLQRGAFDSITQTVNGGMNGSNERWAAYGRATTTLGVAQH